MKRLVFFTLSVTGFMYSTAQKMTTDEYIAAYKDLAIENMKLKAVPASITLAQGILESGNGNSTLAKEANNHFGIKCHKGWEGESYHMDDDAPDECFRKYVSVLDSYKDHADFLSGRERYSKCFALELTDYAGWAKELKAAGYATSPTYAESLIGIIEKYELYQYDEINFDDIAEMPETTDTVIAIAITNTATEVSSDYEVNFLNGLRIIKVKPGQTKASIALAFDLKVKQLEKYNEIGAADEFAAGETVYVEPKKYSAAKGNDTHTVKAGETLYSIAQLYGVKMESLMKKNHLWYGSKIKEGDTLNLRRKKKLD